MTTTTGRLIYTDRAFEQDADQAMAGDIVRALIELITNADDAYGVSDGQITVDVVRQEGSPTLVAVHDVATGLSADELDSCFGVLGGVNQRFVDGVPVRGLLGRGAKDTAAFGRTVFETIKDGVYGRFELRRDSTFEKTIEPATPEHHARLEIPDGQAGLVATIHVEQPGITIPKANRLAQRLGTHVQLRRLTTGRQVVLRWSENGTRSPSQVVRWNPPAGETLVDLELDIEGYEATAHLVLSRMTNPAEGRVGSYSRQGIEVHGEKAAYDNTFFGESAPETSWIHGVLECPYIEELIRAFDDQGGPQPSNPIRLLRRDRDGLVSEHPFSRALTAAVLKVLVPILEDLKPKRSTAAGGDKLRADLEAASRALAQLLKDDLDRIDDDEPHRGGTRPTVASPLQVIPPRLDMAPDSRRTLTVLVHDPAFDGDVHLTAASSAQDRVEIIEVTAIQAHAVYPDTSIANVRIGSLAKGKSTIVVSAPDGRSASCQVTVKEIVAPEDLPPDGLEWKNQAMSVTVGKTRTVKLRAPLDLGATGRLVCTITGDGDAVGISDGTVTLELVDDGWLEGTCTVTGVAAGESISITATGGGQTAVGRIRVTRPSGFGGLLPDIQLRDMKRGSSRGQVEETDTGFLIEVYGRHPGIAELLGPVDDEGSFRNEQDRHVRVAIAEVVASVIADWLVVREARRYPQDFQDAGAAINQRSQNLARYLLPLQRAIAGEQPEPAG